jgi:hypothetical protein
VIPHPFGSRTPDEVRAIAAQCLRDIVAFACQAVPVES